MCTQCTMHNGYTKYIYGIIMGALAATDYCLLGNVQCTV